MPKLLEGHSRPITQNLVAAALWEFLYRGIPTIVTLFSGYKAFSEGWSVPWVLGLGAVVFLSLSIGLHLLVLLRNRGKSQVTEADSTDPHEDCQRQIRNLKSTIARLQRNDQTQGIQISSRDTRIEQLQTDLDALKWLVQIADEQGKTIHRFVSIPDFRIGRFELYQRNDPYIEFDLIVWNNSVHDIYLSELSGSVEFSRRELTGPLQWKKPLRSVTWSNQESFTFRQNLSSNDVSHIMNGPACFSFYSLDIGIKGFGTSQTKVDPQPLPLGTFALDNGVLLSKYPKLNVKIVNLIAIPVFNLSDSVVTGSDALVTIQTDVKNVRESAVVIDSISLRIVVKDQPYVAAAEFGEIWEKKHIDKQGRIATSGVKLSNLADRLPLRVLQANVSGGLQFIFKDVGAAILNQNIAYELELIDTNGERHPFNGVINRQPQSS